MSGEDPLMVENALDDVMNSFIKKGPDTKLLKTEKTKALAGFIRGIQRIGGFGGKSDLLATCQTFTGNPGCYRENAAFIDFSSRRNSTFRFFSPSVFGPLAVSGVSPLDIDSILGQLITALFSW